MNTRTTTVGFVATLATAAVLVAGCSTDDNDGHSMGSMGSMNSMPMATSADAATDHNAADVMWTQMMIPHHRQAVEMAALATGRTENPQLLSLAEQIRAAQDPEIAEMSDWLAEWGVPTMPDDMQQSMPGGTTMNGGMMSADEMTRLENSTGAEFDDEWLTMMIAHHQGAIDSSEQIRADGRSQQVRDLAESIITGQQAEIEQMNAMLGR